MEGHDSQEVSENSSEIRIQNVIVQNNASIISVDDEDKIKEEMPGDVQNVQNTTEGGESTAVEAPTE